MGKKKSCTYTLPSAFHNRLGTVKKPFHNSFVYVAIPGTFSQYSDTTDSPQARTIYVWLRQSAGFLLFSSGWPISEAERKRGRERLAFTLKALIQDESFDVTSKSSREPWLSKGHENRPFSQFRFMLLWPNVCELLHLHVFQGASWKAQATDRLMLPVCGTVHLEILELIIEDLKSWLKTQFLLPLLHIELLHINVMCCYVVRICYFQAAQHFGQPRLFSNTQLNAWLRVTWAL